MEYLNFTEANCQNCYKCIRNCKVKAIQITDDQAHIMPERCVGCGECFTICPQNAKSVTTDIALVKQMVKNKENIIVSLAPSFPSFDALDDPLRFIGALHKLGFTKIEETSIGATCVSKQYKEDFSSDKQHVITSSCPSVTMLITKYFSDKVQYLSESISPMMAHNKMIKQENKNVKTVFIGPCISKKEETIICTSKDSCIDAVITFDDIRDWLQEENIDIHQVEAKQLDKQSPIDMKWYPLSGGVEKASNLPQTKRRIYKIDGMENCVNFLEHLDELSCQTWIEMNACKEGCINGFGNHNSPLSLYEKAEQVKQYIESEKHNPIVSICNVDTHYDYTLLHSLKSKTYSEEDIQHVLQQTGKYSKKDELNCGACGYDTCRDKAIAVLNNMANIDMCLPYMRMKNEDVSSIIIEHSPNGIIITDSKFHIIEINPKAQAICLTSKASSINKNIKDILGENIFIPLLRDGQDKSSETISLSKYQKTIVASLRHIKQHDLYLAIFKDITQEAKTKDKQRLRSKQTLDMAQEVIDKQMLVAQEIASLLGETTAETKVTLSNLKRLFDEQL
jgi:iron only hydrogenase large subunit-like protein/DNA-binding MarR family transcriptional regulator